jgi:hypothetical protein
VLLLLFLVFEKMKGERREHENSNIERGRRRPSSIPRERNTQTCLPNKLYTRETPLLLLGVHYSDVMCLKTDEKKRKKKGQVWSVNIA